MKIYEHLLAFTSAIMAQKGNVIRITLDEKGNEALRNEVDVSVACSKRLFGVVIDVAKTCPTCGQNIVEEKTGC